MKELQFRPNGAEYITAQIAAGIANGTRTATITGHWTMEQAVRIPGDFTLILDGCHLQMAEDSFDNLFVNAHHDTDLGRTVDGTDRNIRILGKNGAILDGGKYNGLSEQNHLQDGRPPIWKNNLILFTNVEGFEISGIHCRNQRWWAMNFIYCGGGHLHHLDFCACDIGIDRSGQVYHGLKHNRYKEILVKNADGIDIRQGCHDIVIENITGFTEDDSVALTGLDWVMERHFAVAEMCSDICWITVKNVATAAFCTNVRMLNQGGIKLHDITVDGVEDTSADSPHMERGLYGVRIGDVGLYGARHATADETYNITIRNVRSRGRMAAVGLAGAMRDVCIENITAFDGAAVMEDNRACINPEKTL